MFPKLAVILVLSAVIAATLLHLRQQRLLLMNQMADFQQQMDDNREQTWDLQVRIHQRLTPDQLREAIARRQLDLAPMVPLDPNAALLAEAPYDVSRP
ncbi:MAG: hypothetical protein IT445_18075 [Phycisphaeraceae bacterium]|nr:hypothetical protein [Phycisphaeraceae bacterium]